MDEDSIRLSKLIWRTIKFRGALLLIAGAVLFGILTAVRVGNERLQGIDHDFVQKEADSVSELPHSNDQIRNIHDRLLKDPSISVEMIRRLLPILETAVVSDPSATPLQRTFMERRMADLKNYEMQRDGAYAIDMRLPYLTNTTRVNAIVLADVVPPLVWLILLAVVGLRFQQRVYEVELTYLVQSKKSRAERARLFVMTEFFAGSLQRATLANGKPVWLYSRALFLVPETLVLSAMTVGVIWIAATAITLSEFSSRYPTRSILFGFNTIVFCGIALSALLVWATKKVYARMMRYSLGWPVRSARLASIRALLSSGGRSFRALLPHSAPASRWSRVALISVAVSMLLLPWLVMPGGNQTTVTQLRGVDFMWKQPRTSTVGSVGLYLLDPALFREMRWHLWFALGFLVICLAGSFREHVSLKQGLFARLEKVSAVAIVLLTSNLLVFFLFLILEANSGSLSGAILETILGRGGNLSGDRSLPIVLMNPTVSVAVFLTTCATLAAAVLADARFIGLGRRGRGARLARRKPTSEAQ